VLAMAMGDEFDPNDINAYQLADFAETCAIDKKLLARLLSNLTKQVLSILEAESFVQELIKTNEFSEEEQIYIEQLKGNIMSKAQHLNSQTSMISTIEV
jgi:serine/threonine-protein kinase HipA